MPKPKQVKQWNVRVHRNGQSRYLGKVAAIQESEARAAALSAYGISEEEAEEGTLRDGIYAVDDFDVSETL